jgi:hypothetical protein
MANNLRSTYVADYLTILPHVCQINDVARGVYAYWFIDEVFVYLYGSSSQRTTRESLEPE